MTINDVRYAVQAALAESLSSIAIEEEVNVEQQASPSFVVRLLKAAHTHEHERRFRRYYPFVIEYHSTNQSSDMKYEVAEQLTAALRWITVGNQQYMANDMEFEMLDDVLHFSVSYSVLVLGQEAEAPKMQTLQQGGHVGEKKYFDY